MVYPRCEDFAMVDGCFDDDAAPRMPSFCDDENASFANDLVINLAVGKLNQNTRRETLCRSVLLQNILNDRVQEREVGVQCYGSTRIREVQFMIERQRRRSGGIREQPRAWDDDDDTGVMDVDGYMSCENDETQETQEYAQTACIVGSDGNMYRQEDCDKYDNDYELDDNTNIQGSNEGTDMLLDVDGTADSEESEISSAESTDEDDDEAGSSHDMPDASVSATHPPMRIKLVLSKSSSECSSGNTNNNEKVPRLKRRRSVGADMTNRSNGDNSKGGVMSQPTWYKRTRYTHQDWISMRGLSPVC